MNDPQPVQFDRAEFQSASTNAAPCAQCNQPIIQSYYEVSCHIICAQYRESLMQGSGPSGGRRLLRSLGAGFGAALVGAIVWWGVRTLTGYEVGLISIGI